MVDELHSSTKFLMKFAAVVLNVIIVSVVPANCQTSAPVRLYANANATHDEAVLLTVFLKHDQSKTLDQIEAELSKSGFYRDFPPAGTQIVSWYVMMGIGQVVTLRVPPERLREVNRYFEQRAWGAFRTEFYPTYDFRPAFQELKSQPAKR